jgi:hypothetical protein
MPAQLRQGMIVEVVIDPPRGKPKRRPAIIYTPDDQIPLSNIVKVIGITGSYWHGDPRYIPLPWRDDGQIHTRLRKDCAISFDLLSAAERSQIRPTGGCLKRNEPAFVAMLAELKRRAML